MSFFKVGNLKRDEEWFLQDKHCALQFPRVQDATSLHALIVRAGKAAAWSQAAFVLSLGAATLPSKALSLACLVLLIGVLLSRLLVVVVFAASMFAGNWQEHSHRRKSLVFWSWWPLMTLLLAIFGCVFGTELGGHLWKGYVEPYTELSTLQTYHDVDPSITPGKAMQDAGVVGFGNLSDVDRARGGCFVAMGHTYCVAPIVNGGRVLDDVGGAPRTGSYDFFAVGIDCCTCPNQDFRCGDWLNPYAHGGVRSIDIRSRPFYKLAVDDWAAAYRKVSEHALFFDWREDPVHYWMGLRWYAIAVVIFAIAMTLPALLTLSLFVGKLLEVLVAGGFASPYDAPAPPPGFERLWLWFLPDVLQASDEERRQLLSIPVTAAPWYGPRPVAAQPIMSSQPGVLPAPPVDIQQNLTPPQQSAMPFNAAPVVAYAAPTAGVPLVMAPRGVAARPEWGYGMMGQPGDRPVVVS